MAGASSRRAPRANSRNCRWGLHATIPLISALPSRRNLALLLLPVATILSGCGGPTGTNGGDEPLTASQLAFTVQPGDAPVGDPIEPSVEVEVQDASGDRVSGSSARVSIALENNPGGATLTGETTVAFERVSAGRYHSSGLTADGGDLCWGQNDRGQLGDGTTTDRTAPVEVAGDRSSPTAVSTTLFSSA